MSPKRGQWKFITSSENYHKSRYTQPQVQKNEEPNYKISILEKNLLHQVFLQASLSF